MTRLSAPGTMQDVRSEERNDASSVVGKIDAILGAFDPENSNVSLAELVRRTGLAKSTLHRLTGTLVEAGMLDRENGGFQLGLRMFELGQLVPRQRALRDAALPFMEDLYEATHETVHLAVRDGTEIVYVEKIVGHRTVKSPSRIGGRMPLHCTAIGKAMLAFSPPSLYDEVVAMGLTRRTPYTIVSPALLRRVVAEVAERGVAFDYEESRLGLTCAAAPVFGPGNRLLGGLSVTGATTRVHPEEIAPAVKTASLSLSRLLASGF